MTDFFNTFETQSAPQREANLMAELVPLLSHAKANCEHYSQTLADIDVAQITTREQLASLPITRKSDLIELQRNQPPFAGVQAKSAKVDRIFQSPGPINEPENVSEDWWRMGQAFYAAGFRAGDKVQNCLSYHLTPGGFILDSGARACGCSVIAAGPGQTDQQLDVIESLQPEGYCGTPSFLKILLDKANSTQRNISSINKALVTGEAYLPALRSAFKEAGINALQAYATADIGLIGFESDPHEGLIIAEGIILEIVRPGTGQLVKPGEVGEIVITRFDLDYPLIRFATGDLTAQLLGVSACGRTNMRIKGWMGRADQTTKVKGMFIHPEQIEKIRSKYRAVVKAKLVVTREGHNDSMELICEVDQPALLEASELSAALAASLKSITKINGQVSLVKQGVIADDGKVIDDQRPV